MYLYGIAGRTRQGKSRYTKAMITHPNSILKPCFVYDYQNEYGLTYKTLINGAIAMVKGPGLPVYDSENPNIARSRYTGSNLDEFITIAAAKRKTNIIFEEATIFFQGRTSKEVKDLIVSRFHTENNLIFVFHDIGAIPPQILKLTNYIVLFKTTDSPKKIYHKYENDLLAYGVKYQEKQPNGAKAVILDLYNNTFNGKDFSQMLNNIK